MNVGNLAVVAHDAGRLEEAKALYERALSIHREVGDRRLEAEVVGLLAVVAHEEARLDDARQLYMKALEMHRQVGNCRAEGTLLGYLGNFLVEVGEREEARSCFSRALTILRECGDTPTEGLVLGGLAALEATEGCIESARGALARATECLKGRDARYLAAVEIDRGHLELALARDAARTGDESRAKMYTQSVRQRIAEAYGTAEGYNMARTGYAHRSADVRLAVRSLRQALEAGPTEPEKEPHSEEPKDSLPPLDLPAEALVVDARGRWFRAPHGEHVSISRWKSLQNLVEKLAERREIAPGMALSVEDLVSAGWPGERILPKAGATRVYTALSTLRRLGLRDVLTRRDGGYLFSPAVPLVRVSSRR
jgi:tetratricopeptide (TPR) repeat protein